MVKQMQIEGWYQRDVAYLPDGYEIVERPLWWQEQGLSFTASGYGKKIPTSKMVRIGKRLYRIYCAIFSNAGICYIMKDGKRLVVRDFYDSK